jgi:CRISPR/Cas system-associated exonuclease Cas4 (RecB family)
MEETKICKLYKGAVKIKFVTDHADKHAYYDEKGKKLRGVTYFTSVIDKSEAMKGWAVKQMGLFFAGYMGQPITEDLIDLGKKEYRNVSKEAKDIGKQIHAWIEEWMTNKNLAIPEDSNVRNGVNAFMAFQAEQKVKWIESERLIFSKKYQYAGTADAIGKIGKDLILIDFKSSKPSTYSPDGVYPEHAIQTAGYQLAYEEETGKKIDYRMIITLNKETGEPKFREFRDNEKDKKGFIACVNLRRRLDELKI